MAESDNNVLSSEAVGQIRQLLKTVKPAGGNAPQFRAEPPRESVLRPPLLTNSGDEEIPAWACCAVTDVSVENAVVHLTVAKPSTTFVPFYVFNGPQPIPAGQTKIGQLGEIEKVLYNDSASPVNGAGLGPVPGQWYVDFNYPQCAICQGVFDATNLILLVKRIPVMNGTGTVASVSIANKALGNITITAGSLATLASIGMTKQMRNGGPDVVTDDEVRWGYSDGQLEFFKICTGTGGGGGVTSVTYTGDGVVHSSTPSSAVTSTGTLTSTLANAAAKTMLGNPTGSSTTPSYTTTPVVTSVKVDNTGGVLLTDVSSSYNVKLSTSSTLGHDGFVNLNPVPLVSGGGTTYGWTVTLENNVALDQNLRTTSTVRFDAATITTKCVMGAFSLGGANQIISVTADTDDLAITDDASIVYLLPDDDWTITGLDSSDNQVWYEVHNASSTKTLTLTHEDASSSTFNRFHFASGGDFTLGPRASVLIYYPDSRWRLVVDSQGTGTVTSVALTMPTGFSVGGSPVTTSGTLAVTTALSGVVTANGSAFSATAIPSDATKFLNGAATPAFALVKDSDLSLSNITTNNVSITAHGFTPILPNDAAKFLDGTGAWTVPTGSGVTFANPTASVGLSAVNGSAGTAMRSDGAPALSQSIAPTWTGIHTFNTGKFRLADTANDNFVTVVINENQAADRTLNLILGASDRTITLTGNPTLADWFDQAVKTSSSPTHVTATLSGLTASKPVFTDGSKALTSSGTVPVDQGGTGQTSYTDGQLLIGNTTGNTLAKSTLTAGANITITNGGGTITIAAAGGGGGGAMVGPVSVVTANGFAGTVANATTVPAITLTTTINAPALAGNGTAISAATTTGSGSTVVLGTAPSIATSLTLTGSSPPLVLNDALGTHTLSVKAGSTLTGNRILSLEFDNNAVLALAGDLTTNAAIEFPVIAQGDIVYGSAADVLSSLAKDTNASRYLSNTGTTNNPAWAQVNLANGVTGTLPVGNGGTGQTSYTDGQLLIGNTTGNTLSKSTLTAGTGIGITNGHGTITITATGGTGPGGVTSVGITGPSEGLTITNSPITLSGDIDLAFANDLLALESITGSGVACRVGTDDWELRTITGTSNRISVNNGDGVSGEPTIDISSTYVGQASITTLGVISTGEWRATTVATNYGGTGQTTYSAGQLLIGTSGASLAKATLTGTSNQVNVTNGSGSITLSLPQDINAGATPTFNSMTLQASQGTLRMHDSPAASYLSIVNSIFMSGDRTLSLAIDANLTLTLAGSFTTAGALSISNVAAKGDLLVGGSANTLVTKSVGANGTVLVADSTQTGGVKWDTVTGSGSVSDFSAGNLSPLFTTSVATSTSTPALTFALSNAAANTYFGNPSTSSGAPSYASAAALTTANDTNVTLTAGTNSATALLRNAIITAGWTGTLAFTRGGFGFGSATTGDTFYADSSTSVAKLAIGASGRWYGSSGSAPQWNAPAALTTANDTNVTLTAGTNAATALLNAALITVGWTGDLAYDRLTPSTAASRLLGRRSASAGDWEEITLGTGLSMSGTTISSTGGSGITGSGTLDSVMVWDTGNTAKDSILHVDGAKLGSTTSSHYSSRYLDLDNLQFYDGGGASDLSADFLTHELSAPATGPSTPVVTLSWDTGYLRDNFNGLNKVSADWFNRYLFARDGSNVKINWDDGSAGTEGNIVFNVNNSGGKQWVVNGLPNSNPGGSGRVWNNGGVLSIT